MELVYFAPSPKIASVLFIEMEIMEANVKICTEEEKEGVKTAVTKVSVTVEIIREVVDVMKAAVDEKTKDFEKAVAAVEETQEELSIKITILE